MIYNTYAEWLANNPIYKWRAGQTKEDEVPVPMQVVADHTQATRQAVSNWERGVFMPKYALIVKLADLLQYESSDALHTAWQVWLESKPADASIDA